VTTGLWWLLGGGVFLVVMAWTAWTLVRLRRLEERVARAWTALDLQLQRRAGLAAEVARDHPDVVGPERAPFLVAFAADARAPRDGDREMAENLLGRELRELGPDVAKLPAALRDDLIGTVTRVGLARRFYNDAVRDTRALRRARFSRLLRLHASRPLPRFFDIDDRPGAAPTGAGGAGGTGRRPPYDGAS
jgi:hypothetical protein